LGTLPLLLSATLAACTPAARDGGPSSLERHVDDSGSNRALSFDGIDDYATTATAGFPDGHSASTVSTWFRLDNLTGKQVFIVLRKDLDSGLVLGAMDGAVTAWMVSKGGKALVAASSTVTVDTWHHAAYTFDATTNRLYVDGVLVASSVITPDKRTPLSCWLGTMDGSTQLLHGSLDDVHVFFTQRSATEIAGELSQPVSTNDANLAMALTFDESGGPAVYDHSSFENDGELGDGVTSRMPKRVDGRKVTN
jgi:hypothetical protein